MLSLTTLTAFTSILLSVSPTLAADSFQLLPKRAPAPDHLWPRSTFFGGFALSASSCPKDTISCGESEPNDKGTCCPKDTVCFGLGLNVGVVCCPDKNDCSDQVVAAPVCASTQWDLYAGFENEFCCQPDEKGVIYENLTDLNGICIPGDAPLATSSSASKIAPASTETAAASSSASAEDQSPSSSSSTPASVTSRSGGSSPSSSSSSPSAPSTTAAGNGIATATGTATGTGTAGTTPGDASALRAGWLGAGAVAMGMVVLGGL